MVFLGTPFRGSRHAKWADILQNIAHAFTETNTNKTRDLLATSDKLKILAEAFPEVLRKVNSNGLSVGVAFFIETLKYKKLLVGPRQSSILSDVTLTKSDRRRRLGLDSWLWGPRKYPGQPHRNL